MNNDFDKDLLYKTLHFLDCFETVFDNDWYHTRENIRDKDAKWQWIPEDKTLLDPECVNDNWSNHANLVERYLALRAYLVSNYFAESEECLLSVRYSRITGEEL
ncbi:hypothetical protein ACE1CI_19155 [Aerosakkonemataceae cyanobacterium BLCC-F50]|uniref:Uncharacterized protein n=1 Tax=Floridaenema flaviceps BLCC-F50 TaxID=3153642 RepID=A0ABV4XTI2_9CYAN